MVSKFQEDCCIIYKLGFTNDKPVTVSRKGILSLISCSESRGCSELHAYLTESINKTPIGKFLVHENSSETLSGVYKFELVRYIYIYYIGA